MMAHHETEDLEYIINTGYLESVELYRDSGRLGAHIVLLNDEEPRVFDGPYRSACAAAAEQVDEWNEGRE